MPGSKAALAADSSALGERCRAMLRDPPGAHWRAYARAFTQRRCGKVKAKRKTAIRCLGSGWNRVDFGRRAASRQPIDGVFAGAGERARIK
jgi:hypothetical protein